MCFDLLSQTQLYQCYAFIGPVGNALDALLGGLQYLPRFLLAIGDRLLGLALGLKHPVHGLLDSVRCPGAGVFTGHAFTSTLQRSMALERIQVMILSEGYKQDQYSLATVCRRPAGIGVEPQPLLTESMSPHRNNMNA